MTAAPASAQPASRWDDYLDVFVAPAQLFRRRADGKFGHALLVFWVLMVALFFGTRSAMRPVMDVEIDRSIAQAAKANPQMTPEQVEQGREIGRKFAPVGFIFTPPILVLVLGAVVWMGAMTTGGRVSYAQGATIATFALFPKLVETISGAVQSLLMDEGNITSRFSVSLGAGRFIDPSNAVLLALLGRVDLFTLWVTVLIGVGLKAMAKVSTGQAVGGAAVVWVIGALPTLWQALRAG
jgi:hypothetical protein